MKRATKWPDTRFDEPSNVKLWALVAIRPPVPIDIFR